MIIKYNNNILHTFIFYYYFIISYSLYILLYIQEVSLIIKYKNILLK